MNPKLSTAIAKTQRTMQPRWLFRFLDSQDINTKSAVNALGKTPKEFLDENGRMPLDAYLQVFEWAAREYDRPHLGLELATDIHNGEDIGVLAYLLTNSKTYAEGCKLFERYEKILQNGASIQSIEHKDVVEIRYTITTEFGDLTTQDAEFTLAASIYAVKYLANIDIVPFKVCFTHQRIEPHESYRALFGDHVFFGQPSNSLWINYDVWNQPIPHASPVLLNILEQQAHQLLTDLEASGNFLEHVRFLIASNMSRENLSADMLADQLHITRRTLHRRLEEHGTNFKQLRQECVASAARQALRNSDASIADIAQELGYSDSSSLVRAFKRFHGISPLQYRKQERG